MQAFDYVHGRDAGAYDGLDDTSYYDGVDDTEGLFDFVTDIFQAPARAAIKASSLPPHLKAAASRAVSTITPGKVLGGITNNPLWDIVKTGASFIPGIGTAVSAGMAAAAAVGRGESLADIGLAAAKSAIPGGPLVQAGLDIAIGAVRGQNLGDVALKQVRARIPGGELAKGVFDAGVAITKKLGQSQIETIRANQTPEARKSFDAALAAHRNPTKPVVVDPLQTKEFWEKAAAYKKAVEAQQRTKALGASIARVAARPPALRAAHVQVRTVPQTSRPANIDRPFPHLATSPNRVASQMLKRPELRMDTVQQLAAKVPSVDQRDAQKAIAAFLTRFHGQRVFDAHDVGEHDSIDTCARRYDMDLPGDLNEWPGETGAMPVVQLPPVAISRDLIKEIYRRGDPNIKKSILAHGLLAHIARNTGELQGTEWVIRSGDNPWKVSEKMTGEGNRWKEIAKVNPSMPVINNGTALKGWNVNKRFQVPPSWMPTLVPLPAAPPAVTATVARPGGPPFPSPSEYPNGYPSSVYTVKSGDTGEKIAARITGDKDRWRELLTTNPKRASAKYGFEIYAGNQITLPPLWVAAMPQPQPPQPVVIGGDPMSMPSGFTTTVPEVVVTPGPDVTPHTPAEAMPQPGVIATTTTTPGATPGPVVSSGGQVFVPPPEPTIIGSTEQLGSIQTVLASFYRDHVDASYSVPGGMFGSMPEDFAGVWNDRTRAAFAGFQAWWNARGKAPHLNTDGLPSDATVAALVTQVKEDTATGGGAPQTVVAKTSPTTSAPKTTAKKKSGGDSAAALLLLLPFLAL